MQRKIIHLKEAYLLIDLLRDLQTISSDSGLTSPAKETRGLRRLLEKRFGDELAYFNTGRNCIVHYCEINPCEYSVATIKGKGIRDDDIIRAFGALVRRKIEERKEEKKREACEESFPYPPERVIEMIDDGPLPELYNAMYATLFPSFKCNEYGYAETESDKVATKIWSLASDWESLITGAKNGKQIITGSVIGRLTGRKDVLVMLNKLGHSIPYDSYRIQTKHWSEIASEKGFLAPMVKGVSTHVTMDNNDGGQETMTGKGTTHDTNFTIFQPVMKNEVITPDKLFHAKPKENLSLESDLDEKMEIPEYNIGQKKSPPLFKDFSDNTNTFELEKSLKEDLVWAITIGMEKEEDRRDDFIGSWTDFKKKTVNSSYQKSLLEYLPTVAQPPEYPVCKKFLDDLLELMDDLGLGHIFAHADEQVYARLSHILWKDPDLYQNVVVLMGGFHQLRVRQKIIHNEFLC